MDSGEVVVLALIVGVFAVLGLLVHESYKTDREALSLGYIQVQTDGTTSTHWVKEK